jgi:hypothetical protein
MVNSLYSVVLNFYLITMTTTNVSYLMSFYLFLKTMNTKVLIINTITTAITVINKLSYLVNYDRNYLLMIF